MYLAKTFYRDLYMECHMRNKRKEPQRVKTIIKPKKVNTTRPRKQTQLSRRLIPRERKDITDIRALSKQPSKNQIESLKPATTTLKKNSRTHHRKAPKPTSKPTTPKSITLVDKGKNSANKTKKRRERVRNLKYEDFKINWSQHKNRLILDCVLGKYFFKMPPSWKLANLGSKYLRLAEVVIFKPFWDPIDLKEHLNKSWEPLSKKKVTIIKKKDPLTTKPETETETGTKTETETKTETKTETPKTSVAETSTKRVGIAFSGGNDSCACVAILPKDSVLIYLKRVWNVPRNILKHGQQLKCLNHLKKHWKRPSFIMETNIEQISQYSIGRVGFSTDYVPAVPTILLANHYRLKYVCTGTIGLYLKAGVKYYDFLETEHYKFWTMVFKKGGIELFWPVGGCSDRVTDQICQRAKIPGQPCLRNDHGCCNRCFKCFRKNYLIQLSEQKPPKPSIQATKDRTSSKRRHVQLLTHQPLPNRTKSTTKSKNVLARIPINKEIYARLRKRPISRILTKKMGWIDDRDIKASHLKMDFSFENGYYPELTEKLVPEELRSFVIRQLNKWSRPMAEEELKVIQSIDLSRLII